MGTGLIGVGVYLVVTGVTKMIITKKVVDHFDEKLAKHAEEQARKIKERD